MRTSVCADQPSLVGRTGSGRAHCDGCGSSTIMRANKARLGALMMNCLPQPCSSLLPDACRSTVQSQEKHGLDGVQGPFYPRRVRTMNRISLWQSCAPMRPQQMAQSSKSFMRTRAAHEILPHQHVMDTGYGDAEVLAESQLRYHVDSGGPVLPDTSWSSKAAERAGSQRLSH